jgi:hypothetical protein
MANKWWEADPLCGVLIHDKARSPELTEFSYQRYPAPRAKRPKPGDPLPPDPQPLPRMVFRCGNASVEVWCLEELMNPGAHPSSSAEKARVLRQVFTSHANLVVAFGTAGSREGVSSNGSVVIGRQVFVHDPLRSEVDRTGLWDVPLQDQLIDSAFPYGALGKWDDQARLAAEARFLPTPIAPAQPPLIIGSEGMVSVGVVNITKYEDYCWADRRALQRFASAVPTRQAGSIETTHGIIRFASEAPFVYVSAITDTEGLFDFQVSPRAYSQNTAAAHNAGVALAWMLPSLIRSLPA